MDLQNLEDSCNMDSFIDSTFEFLDQETKIYDEADLKISKLVPTIGQGSEQKESNMPSILSCASPSISFLDQVSDELLSSASKHSLRNGCSSIEKYLDSEFQFPTVGSSTEVLSTSTFGTNPPSLPFDQVDSLNPSNISLAQTNIYSPEPSLSASVCPRDS